MSMKTEWIRSESHPELWQAQVGKCKLEVYRNLGSNDYAFSAFVESVPVIEDKPLKTTLSSAKRMATRWLAKHLGEQTEPEQQTALNLAQELERLGYMEARLLNALTFAKSEDERELLLQILGRDK